MAKIIPFGRQLKVGKRGKDVAAVKRALSRAGFIRWGKFSRVYGPFMRKSVKNFQKSADIAQSGVYGIHTHQHLVRRKNKDGALAFDPYAILLYTGEAPVSKKHKLSKEDRLRQGLVAAAISLYNIRDNVHYTQTWRRMQIVREHLHAPFHGSISEDCSSSVTGLYYSVGAPDPNGRGFDGQGYTGTLCVHGKRIPLNQAEPGDLAFYGPHAPWGHVTMYLGHGKWWSHGSEGGPYIVDVNYRSDLGEVRTYLRGIK